MSRLFLDYVEDWQRVQKFYPNDYSIDTIVRFAHERQARGLPHKEALCRALAEQQRRFGGSSSSVEKLAAGAVAIVAGQQPGLFTGPLYTILKAVTVIRLARAVSEAGVPAVPVFWVASEDHDYEEIHWASVIDRDSALRRVAVDLANEQSTPVGWLQFKDDVRTATEDCLASLPASEFQPGVRDLLESAYTPGRSPVESFATMMARLFSSAGLIVVDPLDPAIKAIAEPTLAEVVRRNGEIRSAVLARSKAISQAGYHEQVRVDSQFTGLFALRGKSRLPLRPDDVGKGDVLSPNVLVRPVVQDSIFPTAAFVAGPAEIAYLAQAAAVYETLGKPVTPFVPRISATLLESRVLRALRKYNLEFGDIFQGKDFIKRRAVESVQGADLFAKVKDNVNASLESLRGALEAVDPTLIGALETSKQKMAYQVEALETRFINAETRRNEVLEKQLDLLGNSIFPEKKFQERVLNVTSFLVKFGPAFVERLIEGVQLDSRQHQVIDL